MVGRLVLIEEGDFGSPLIQNLLLFFWRNIIKLDLLLCESAS